MIRDLNKEIYHIFTIIDFFLNMLSKQENINKFHMIL